MKIIEKIDEYIATHSNFDTHRDYLGMSKISGCPRQVVNEYLYGTPPSELAHRMSYAGYEQERMVREMLFGAGIARLATREIVSPFDARLKGHIDAETVEGDLLEIKSVSVERFRKLWTDDRPLLSHNIQVQLYMRYGSYRNCLIVYRCRETYEHLVFDVRYNAGQAEKYEAKAKRILEAIDSDILPGCECGRCK
jgi:hypothetical protein